MGLMFTGLGVQSIAILVVVLARPSLLTRIELLILAADLKALVVWVFGLYLIGVTNGRKG